jgi:hypothetical protein
MFSRSMNRGTRAVLCLALAGLPLAGCGGSSPPSTQPSARASAVQPVSATAKKPRKGQPSETDLEDALDLARASLKTLKKIDGYTCVFTKQERSGNELLPEERLALKVRHQPFSVYLRFLGPTAVAGQEAIYVEGQNDGNIIAHAVGIKSMFGRVSLDPHGYLATGGGPHSITDTGMVKLVEKLLALGAQKDLFQNCQVTIREIEFADRPAKQVEIRNPAPVGDFRLAVARIVLDTQWNVPVHFVAYHWPDAPNDELLLMEEYSYLDIDLDPGLTDFDFNPDNPTYAFP